VGGYRDIMLRVVYQVHTPPYVYRRRIAFPYGEARALRQQRRAGESAAARLQPPLLRTPIVTRCYRCEYSSLVSGVGVRACGARKIR
jgi:hypothetical protein